MGFNLEQLTLYLFNYQKIKYTILSNSKIFKRHIFGRNKYSTFKKIIVFDLNFSFYLNLQLPSFYFSYFVFKITKLKSIFYFMEFLRFQEDSLFARYFVEIFFLPNPNKFDPNNIKTFISSDFRHLLLNRTKGAICSEFIEISIFNIKLKFSKKKFFSLKKKYFLSLYLYLDLSFIKIKKEKFQHFSHFKIVYNF
jgi:hypothetical protein